MPRAMWTGASSFGMVTLSRYIHGSTMFHSFLATAVSGIGMSPRFV